MKRVKIKHHTAASIQVKDHSKPKLSAYEWVSDDQRHELSVKNNALTLPNETGKHVIEITADWPNGNASYTFVVEVE
ncbi:hypothetical protein GMB86_01670 [Terrilactibacillus sp. BCM23-1]|uniref:Ig-like domain-containing protein n=1 Tax=Terrilactibacillus tamarindi TaxID=2599694 RepID=A0A6N8CLN3_9BACI|nr:hypothetical protein [Terrilactibacillus tamarindi]MTT30721.1 hypothetical protein [Terrilactibacillus tamarindi]